MFMLNKQSLIKMTIYDKPFYFFSVKYQANLAKDVKWENMIHYVKYPRTWIPATFPQVLVCTSVLTSDPWYHSEEEDEDSDGEGQWGSWTLQLLLSPHLTCLWRISSFWFYSTPNPYTHFYAQTCVLKTQTLMHPKAPLSFYTSSPLSLSLHPIQILNSECELTSFDCKRSLEILRANLSAPCGSPQSHWLHSWKKKGKRLREKDRERGRKRKVV